jgi:hypothetical protein
MDAEGARALARRIEEGPPAQESGFPHASPPRERQIFGMHVVRTVTTRVTLQGRPALIRQRRHSTLTENGWRTETVEETVEYLD